MYQRITFNDFEYISITIIGFLIDVIARKSVQNRKNRISFSLATSNKNFQIFTFCLLFEILRALVCQGNYQVWYTEVELDVEEKAQSMTGLSCLMNHPKASFFQALLQRSRPRTDLYSRFSYF